MTQPDPFPPSDFDAWAESYDQSTREFELFPFAGYELVLETLVSRAEAQKDMSVLDLGTGTGNIAARFDALGCQVFGSDFAPLMLEQARAKLPHIPFVLHDLRQPWPAALDRRFDRIVSGYTFHHFELEKKVSLCRELVSERLTPGGRLVIADLSFPSFAAKEIFKASIPDWEEEFYWFADESLVALEKAGLTAAYQQVSPCAGVYAIR